MSKIVLGKHLLVEYYGCDMKTVNDLAAVREAIILAAKCANATIIDDVVHKFSPHGISGIVIIAESHLAIHTWPDYQFASVDIFTCNGKMNTDLAIRCLKEKLGAEEMSVKEIERGRFPRRK